MWRLPAALVVFCNDLHSAMITTNRNVSCSTAGCARDFGGIDLPWHNDQEQDPPASSAAYPFPQAGQRTQGRENRVCNPAFLLAALEQRAAAVQPMTIQFSWLRAGTTSLGYGLLLVKSLNQEKSQTIILSEWRTISRDHHPPCSSVGDDGQQRGPSY